LQAAGVDRNTPVTVHLRQGPFRKALTTILAGAGKKASFGYTIDDGNVTISTKRDLNASKNQVIRVCYIRELLVSPAPAGKDDATKVGGKEGANGTQPGAAQDTTRAKLVRSIMDTIKATIAPDSWRDNGGTIGSLRELNGQLIVNQNIDNQMAI